MVGGSQIMENGDQLYYYPLLFGFKPLVQIKEFLPILASTLEEISSEKPLTLVILNQLLSYNKQEQVSPGFFKYYFLEKPSSHPYSYRKLVETEPELQGLSDIVSIQQLEFGARRFIADALLYFPSIKYAFNILRVKNYEEIISFFKQKRVDSAWMQARKKSLPLNEIEPKDRYLISEAACKAYRTDLTPDPLILTELIRAYRKAHPKGPIPIKTLVDIALSKSEEDDNWNVQLTLSVGTEEIMEKEVSSEEDIQILVNEILGRFQKARKLALDNTTLYCSDRKELDVYVATSMRVQNDFINMARECNKIFGDSRLKSFYVRYFDPTLSAANNHLEKGVLECIMVDNAKVVLYLAEEKDTWGKMVEASRALHQGKPLIIYAPPTVKNRSRAEFFRDIHPLTRLIDMRTGVIVGAIVAKDINHVVELLMRIFSNKMEYTIHNIEDGGICLKESLTSSIVRIETGNEYINYILGEYYNK